MQLNTLSPAARSRQARKRVGRGPGSGTGKTCGRGDKGQKSRSGGSIRIGFEGGQMPLQRRLPKFGFSTAKSRTTAEVNLDELTKLDETEVDLAVLKAAGVVAKSIRRAKVIASGTITKAVTLKGVRATKGAREAIEVAGGKIEE